MEVYILHSKSLNRYYVGQTQSLQDRILYHNSGYGKYTKKGIPWQVIWHQKVDDRSEAMKLEKKIKSRGAARFLDDLKKN